MDKEELKAVAADYEAYDEGFRTDPFKKIHWGVVEGWHKASCRVVHERDAKGRFKYGYVLRRVRGNRMVRDFTFCDSKRFMRSGEWECLAHAWARPKDATSLWQALSKYTKTGLWMARVNQENPCNKAVLMGLGAEFITARISGVGLGDIYGVYYAGPRRVKPLEPIHRVCFGRLKQRFKVPDGVEKLLAKMQFAVTDRGERYGGSGNTWTRVNLRLAGAERESEQARAEFCNHEVFEKLPFLLKAVKEAVPISSIDYTMLTKVAPTEGVIKRHSDVALDRKAKLLGITPGTTMRLHFCLQSNPKCEFQMWDLNGRQHSLVMKAGEIWYTDVRKPHAVANGGTKTRIHLMSDVYVPEGYEPDFDKVIGG